MIKSKVFEILNSFTKEEFKTFYDFVSSPFFNKKEVLIKLTQVYKDRHPDFDNENFTKEKVFKKIFPGKDYNDEVFRNLNSDLMKIAERFLSQINFSSIDFLPKKHLIREITKRKLYPLFEKAFNDTKDMVENYHNKDIKYLHAMYELFLEKDIFNSFELKFSKEDITQAESYLIKYFAIKIIEIQKYILYQCRLHGVDKNLILRSDFIDSFLKELPGDISQMMELKIYFFDLKLEQTMDEKYYHKLKNLLFKSGDLIEKENLYNMYMDLQNFIQRTRSLNDIAAISEIFELRKIVIEKKIYTENFISNAFFINMVKSGILLKKLDWVKDFIKDYGNIIANPYRQSTRELSLALLDFANGNYESSLAHLAKVRYESSFYNLAIKNLTSRIYYEKNDFETLSSVLNSYRAYISTNKTISETEVFNHTVFITNVSRLIRIKEDKKFEKLEIVEESVMSNDFPSKIWIMDKIKELNGF